MLTSAAIKFEYPYAEQMPATGFSPILLRAQGLKIAFGGQVVLDDVDIDLHQGDVVLLHGENGSGKTTLLNILTGNLEPEAGTIEYLADGSPRTYRFPRRWWHDLNPFDHFTPEFVAREGVGRNWQDVRLFKSQRLIDNVAVASTNHPGENPILALIAPGMVRRKEKLVQDKSQQLLSQLGLADRLTSSGDKISLGQSKRVAIARAIAAGARILFLDEPLAGLDRQGVSDVLDMLKSLVRNHSITLVIVEHVLNQPHLHGLVSKEWILSEGKLTNSTSESQNVPSVSSSNHLRPEWFSFFSVGDVSIIDEPLPHSALLTRIRRNHVQASSLKPLLEINNVQVQRGQRSVIGLDDNGLASGFDLTIYEGEIVILQAPNGWGKSTLFDAITGLTPVSTGNIALDGIVLNGMPTWSRVKKGLCALPSTNNTFSGLKAKEAFLLADCKEKSNSSPLTNRLCSSLSGGQKQKIALMSANSCKPSRLHLYDEPFSMLDSKAIVEAASMMIPAHDESVFILIPSFTH